MSKTNPFQDSKRRKQEAEKALSKTLRMTGYHRSVQKYGNDYKVPFPDLSVPNKCVPLSNTFAPTSPKKTLHPDAKQFPVGNLHKSGLTVVLAGEEVDMTGRKF